MSNIAIVYWSGTGNTEAMANLIAAGVQEAGGSASLFTPAEVPANLSSAYDAIAFGCPSMGAEELEDMEFAPMFSALKPSLSGKSIVLFGSYGWGSGGWMQSWEADCLDAGCSLAAEPVIVCGAPEGADAQACRALGAALARV